MEVEGFGRVVVRSQTTMWTRRPDAKARQIAALAAGDREWPGKVNDETLHVDESTLLPAAGGGRRCHAGSQTGRLCHLLHVGTCFSVFCPNPRIN